MDTLLKLQNYVVEKLSGFVVDEPDEEEEVFEENEDNSATMYRFYISKDDSYYYCDVTVLPGELQIDLIGSFRENDSNDERLLAGQICLTIENFFKEFPELSPQLMGTRFKVTYPKKALFNVHDLEPKTNDSWIESKKEFISSLFSEAKRMSNKEEVTSVLKLYGMEGRFFADKLKKWGFIDKINSYEGYVSVSIQSVKMKEAKEVLLTGFERLGYIAIA